MEVSKKDNFADKKISPMYWIIMHTVKAVFPKYTMENTENLPDGPAIIVGNHSKANGPVVAELYIPGPHYTWCIGEMMHFKEVPAYSYKDFWSQKPVLLRPWYKLASYLIAPLAHIVFNGAHTIGVYKDARLINTFKESVERLNQGNKIVIYPEQYVDHNHIVCEFQQNFTDIAKQYYNKTGVALPFVPMYLAPFLHKAYFGKPIYYNPNIPIKEQRAIICNHLMNEITDIAMSLPEHKVVPYRNIPKKYYTTNLSGIIAKRK